MFLDIVFWHKKYLEGHVVDWLLPVLYRLSVCVSFRNISRVSPVLREYVIVQLTRALCLINLYSHFTLLICLTHCVRPQASLAIR